MCSPPGTPTAACGCGTWQTRLYDKLGASNRAQALMTALRHGLIGHGEDGAPGALPVPAPRPAPGLAAVA
jgi:hypothetical protein